MQSRYEMYPQYEEFKVWDSFLKKWPLKRVEEMTIEQYTNLNREDSFTYWIESKTKRIISIKGGSSYKFGIFLRNVEAESLRDNQATDGKYGWYKKYGNTAQEAFENVKKLVIDVIVNAINGNFARIDDIDLGHSYKWKIAFMYAEPGSLIGIVSRQALETIALDVSCGNRNSATSEILQCLISKKPIEIDFWAFTRKLWEKWKNKNIAIPVNQVEFENENFNKFKIKNIILYGVPGVGKTHNITKFIRLIEEGKFDSEIFLEIQNNENSNEELSAELKERTAFVTFHQSFGYEDFIEGFRPNKNAEITIQQGIFKQICRNANDNPDEHYYLIIDEINRGNISKIFGELITLIEEDKRDRLEVTLPYSKEPFSVPSNLYIIGTMNSTDKSIALIDVALRRRFTFLKMEPNASLIENKEARVVFEKLNDFLKERLDDDHQIGHSYFMKIENEDDLKFVLEYKIKPLLEEYFYGDRDGFDEAEKYLDIRYNTNSTHEMDEQ